MSPGAFSSFVRDRVVGGFRRMPGAWKLALLVVVLTQLPVFYLLYNRTFAPFDTDKNPYEHMHMINRVVEGKPLYAPASTDHYSVTYTPLYWWITALVFKFAGASLPVARLVNMFFAVVFLGCVVAFVWKGTEGNLFLAVAAPAMLLLLNGSEGMASWTSDANVNSTHIAFAALGFLLLSGPLTRPRAVLAAAAMSLSLLAKHTGLAYLVAGAVYLLIFNRRLLVPYVVTGAVLVGVPFWHLQAQSNGEFLTIIGHNTGTPPWVPARLWNEVYGRDFFGKFGIMAAAALLPLLLAKKGTFWKTLLTPEYFLCGAGIGVASIAIPKIGSGEVHAMLGYAGLCICGCIGIHQLAKRLTPDVGARVLVAVPLLQVAVLAVLLLGHIRDALIDEYDRAKYAQISAVFRTGRTCLWGVPYIQKAFGQPISGYPGDERSVWHMGRMRYDKPEPLLQPFRRQEFDYIVMPAFMDRSDPMVQVILENYQPVDRLPGHPRGAKGGNLRYDYYVLRANRLGGAMPRGPGGAQGS